MILLEMAFVFAIALYEAYQLSLRPRAVRLAREAVENPALFAEVTKDYGGKGTTCGYLVSWLLAKLGKTQGVNRTTATTRYVVGANISAVRQNSAFVVWESRQHDPKPGDIYFTSDGPSDTEHVGVVIQWGPSAVVTADFGQGDGKGKIVNRKIEGNQLTRSDTGKTRKIVGFIDIEKAR